MRTGVLVGCPDEELERKPAEVVGAAGHLQDAAQNHLELRGVKRRPDQARVLEEQLLRGILAAAAQSLPKRAEPGLRGTGHAPAHVLVIEVREAQKAQRQRWNASAGHIGDPGHDLVRCVADRQQARHDGAGTDAEHHVEVVHAAVGEAIVETLENTHLVVDAGDASA